MKNRTSTDDRFTTSDLNVAAALMSEGFELLESLRSKHDSRRFDFVIGCSPETGRKFHFSYMDGSLMVNLREFTLRVRTLKGIIYGNFGQVR